MQQFDIYVLVLCLIVFTLLVSVFSAAIVIIVKLSLKLIRSGAEDEAIIKEYSTDKKPNKFSKIFDIMVSALLCLIFGAVFVASLYINCTQNVYFDSVPTYRVVQSGSMAEKNEKNTYLVENRLDDQIQTFDLILTYKIPKEEDLKLYDIVVYEVDGLLVVHRIVGIDEAGGTHPNERYFLLQGDAVGSPDRFPVLYSQMRGIYRGERIPFIGSFVMFMQSPAGWLCILLVLVAFIVTPILEKKLANARHARYLLITPSGEIVVTEVAEEKAFPDIVGRRTVKTFTQRLEEASDIMRARYESVIATLLRIEGIRIITAKTQHTYKQKSTPVARLMFRGKTLNVCLGLDPKEYVDTKYIFTDISDKTKHSNYPMRLKLSSERQTRWTCELILELAKKFGFTVFDKPVKVVPEEELSPFAHLEGKKDDRTFGQRLQDNPVAEERYGNVLDTLERIAGVRVIESKRQRTFKSGNTPLVRFAVRGKTLNAYLGLDPKDYVDTKYIFTDVSDTVKYVNYPMRLKLTSERQTRWAKELLIDMVNKNGLTVLEKPVQPVIEVSPFAFLQGKKDDRTFEQRLQDNPIAKERFEKIVSTLNSIDGVRVIDGKKQKTFKLGNTPIVRFAVRGKTLNAYLGLDPKVFTETKYIYKDVSDFNRYSNYPMRVRVTSDRQTRWVSELIKAVINKESL